MQILVFFHFTVTSLLLSLKYKKNHYKVEEQKERVNKFLSR